MKRRGFLKSLLGCATALAVAPKALAKSWAAPPVTPPPGPPVYTPELIKFIHDASCPEDYVYFVDGHQWKRWGKHFVPHTQQEDEPSHVT